MIKRLVPWMLPLMLLNGCAVQDAFNTLQNTMKNGVVLVRSITISNQAHVFIVWARQDASKLQSVKRYLASAATDVDISEAASQSGQTGALEDKTTPLPMPDSTYSYRIRFENSSEINRDITPLGMGSLSGKVTMVSPANSGNPLALTVVVEPKPTFMFNKMNNTMTDRKVGYLVSVAELDPSKESFEPGDNAVVYAAMIDPEKHLNGNVVEVPMGTVTDLPISSELLAALTSSMPAFKPVDGDKTKSLSSGKTYGWTVAPLLYNNDLTAFALGDMANPYFFKAQ